MSLGIAFVCYGFGFAAASFAAFITGGKGAVTGLVCGGVFMLLGGILYRINS